MAQMASSDTGIAMLGMRRRHAIGTKTSRHHRLMPIAIATGTLITGLD
jgi:hypothetical protein